MIFDNAESAEAIRDYIPQGATGHILITSRNQNWQEDAAPVEIKTWDRKDSISFLCKHTCDENVKTANKLADTLGDLPLALSQAKAYLFQTKIVDPDFKFFRLSGAP